MDAWSDLAFAFQGICFAFTAFFAYRLWQIGSRESRAFALRDAAIAGIMLWSWLRSFDNRSLALGGYAMSSMSYIALAWLALLATYIWLMHEIGRDR